MDIMDMDKILNSDEQHHECKTVNKQDLIDKLMAQSNEETKERRDKFLKEAGSIVEFAINRLSEVSAEYEEIAALGNFGTIISLTLQGKPLAYAATGSERAIKDAVQLAMLKTTIAGQFKKDDGNNETGNEGEDD